MWRRQPRREDVRAVWPKEALQRRVGGRATIVCNVNAIGALFNCRVAEQKPAGLGFGQAALELAGLFHMKREVRGAHPADFTVAIPINFSNFDRLAPGPVAAADAPPLLMGIQRMLSDVRWTQAPAVADLVAAYPAKARAAQAGGQVTLDCTFTRTGSLRGCETLDESPKYLGFGYAARDLAAKFRAPAIGEDGKSVEGAGVQLAFKFAPDMLAGPSVIVRPGWRSLPSAEDFNAAFPVAASRAGVLNARVVLACTVQAAGDLGGCTVASEEPAAYGFGQGALGLAPKFQVRLWGEDGAPVIGAAVRVPIRYSFTQAPAP